MARTATHKDGMEALAVLAAGRKVVGTGMQDILAGRATADEVMEKVAEVVPAVNDDAADAVASVDAFLAENAARADHLRHEAMLARTEAAEYRRNGILDGDGEVVTAARVVRDRLERGIYTVEEAVAVNALLDAPVAVNEDRDRDTARAAMNGGRYAGPRKETKVKQEAGPATVAARTARARKVSAKERLTGSPYVAHVLKMAGGELVVPQATVDTLQEAADKMRAAHAARTVEKAAPKPKAAPKAVVTLAEGERQCAGCPKWGIAPHVVAAGTPWGAPTNRSCKECNIQYVLRTKAAKMEAAKTGTTTANARSGRTEPAPVVVVDGTAAQEAEMAALEATLAEVGVETEAGQEVLAKAAAEAAEAKRAVRTEAKRRQRAAAKAAQS